MTELTSDLLEAARQGRRSAVVELLAMYYPVVWRMSTGLTGRQDVGRGVTKFLMQRSLKNMPNWKDEGAPTRWFHHHTLLTTRRTYKHSPDGQHDSLMPESAADVRYAAFIRALRALPMQQREAFILAHGEKLDVRAIAVAMDCSVLAAGNHLNEATDRLRQLDAVNLDAHVLRLSKIYRTLGPDEELAITDIRRRVKQFYFPWLIAGIARRVLAVALVIGAIWATYRVWLIVQRSME
jgi:DNA-directed RNA polymerase specialized sigma24 family protein